MEHVLDRAVEPVVSRLPRWITPNSISIARASAILPIALFHENYPLVVGLGIFVPAMILDIFDGPLARHRGQVSEWGAFLDATADKVVIHGAVWLALYPRIPLALGILVSLLDVLLTAVRPLKRWYGRPIESNHFGKMKAVVQSVGVGFLIVRLPLLDELGAPILAGSVGLAVLSLMRHLFDLFGDKP